MPSATIVYIGNLAILMAILTIPEQSIAVDIVCEKGVVLEITQKSIVYNLRPDYILCLFYLGSDPKMHQVMFNVSNAHEHLYKKEKYFCVVQYDCKKNPVNFDFCSSIVRSEVFMYKSYQHMGFHHTGAYDVKGITKFIKEARKPTAWKRMAATDSTEPIKGSVGGSSN